MSSSKNNALIFRDYAVWAGVAVVFLWLFYLLSTIIIPFVAAALVAYMVEPVVQKLEKWRVRRAFSALLVILAMTLIVLGLYALLSPLIVNELIPLIARLPELPPAILAYLSRTFPSINWASRYQEWMAAEHLKQLLVEQQETIRQLLGSLNQTLWQNSGNALTIIANLVLFPVVLFYFIHSLPDIGNHLKHLFPPKFRTKTLALIGEIDLVLAEYMRGQMLVMLTLAIYYSVTLSLVGLPRGFSIGIITGLLVLIPFLGFALGFSLALFMALISGLNLGVGLDFSLFLGVILIYGVGQLLESYLLTPYLVGERIGLHPLAVIFALLALGKLLGFTGILLALPLSAVLLVLLRQLLVKYRESRLYQLS